MTVRCRAGHVDVRAGAPRSADLVLCGPPDAVLGLLCGLIPTGDAASVGVTVDGDATLLRRLRPSLRPPTASRA